MTKVISISVWGDNPQYLIGALKNVELAKQIFPDWICRIFIDGTVPNDFIEEIEKNSNVELAQIDNDKFYGMFWRFYSMFQNEDDIVISRDSDSRLSKREKKCIDEWLESDKTFSIIRDHDRHYDWPILGGMWGMKGKLDDNILEIMERYALTHTYAIDQVFLKDIIWPIAENNCLIHGFKEIEWMNNTRDFNFIGQGYDQYDTIIYSEESSGEKVNG